MDKIDKKKIDIVIAIQGAKEIQNQLFLFCQAKGIDFKTHTLRGENKIDQQLKDEFGEFVEAVYKSHGKTPQPLKNVRRNLKGCWNALCGAYGLFYFLLIII